MKDDSEHCVKVKHCEEVDGSCMTVIAQKCQNITQLSHRGIIIASTLDRRNIMQRVIIDLRLTVCTRTKKMHNKNIKEDIKD